MSYNKSFLSNSRLNEELIPRLRAPVRTLEACQIGAGDSTLRSTVAVVVGGSITAGIAIGVAINGHI
ncbi:hypothetical protein GCM10007870_24540 [Gluconobacter kondonii]|uniref:Uncharacterized protein n=1 Tax=Gluconobacter kondonii TaxID=941463 RepID=A0ABQ5WW85_9PROT|nr:hypothetical protein GCM10007870_24540 [Gluconobacter kondonii]